MVQNYIEFINEGFGFDKDLMKQILELNNCVEFREHSISMEEVNLSKQYDKDDLTNVDRSLKAASRSIRNIIQPITCLRVLYKGLKPSQSFRLTDYGRIVMIGIKQEGSNYKLAAYLYEATYRDIRYMDTGRVFPHRFNKSEVVNKIKDTILEAELRYIRFQENVRRLEEIKIKKHQEDLEKFNKNGINNQFIMDEFANVFDICDSYKVPKIKFGSSEISIHLLFKASPLTKRTTRSGSRGDTHFDHHYGQMDDQTNDILSELIEVSGRLKDDRNIITYINFNPYGIEVILNITNLK